MLIKGSLDVLHRCKPSEMDTTSESGGTPAVEEGPGRSGGSGSETVRDDGTVVHDSNKELMEETKQILKFTNGCIISVPFCGKCRQSIATHNFEDGFGENCLKAGISDETFIQGLTAVLDKAKETNELFNDEKVELFSDHDSLVQELKEKNDRITSLEVERDGLAQGKEDYKKLADDLRNEKDHAKYELREEKTQRRVIEMERDLMKGKFEAAEKELEDEIALSRTSEAQL